MHGGNVWQGASPDKWLDYSANIRPEGAPDWVKDALADAMNTLSYYPDPQMRAAKRALSDYLDLPEDYILPTAGGISAIDMASHLESTAAMQFTPCFAEYALLSGNRGKPVKSISLLTGRHTIGDPAELAQGHLIEGGAVWLCNPLNPVGCAFGAEAIDRLLAVVERQHGFLVVDEAFIAYCPEHSVLSRIRESDRLLVTGSMTKILGIPGVRLGYLCAQPHVLKRIAKFQLTWEVNCFAQKVLCALPGHRADIRADAEVNARRRAHLAEGLRDMGIYVYPSEASFILADFGRPVDGLAERLKARGILTRRCMDFDGVNDGNHLRLAVKDEASNRRLIETIWEEITCAENR